MKEFVTRTGALFAEFSDPSQARTAYDELRARGYARVDTYSPFPLSHEQAEPSAARPGLAITVAAFGALGAIVGYLVQWYANSFSYPLNIGGRPTHAALAFVYPTFESTILFAAVTAFILVLVSLRLPRLWQPVFEINEFERVSLDRYWVVVGLGSGGGDLDRTTSELESLDAIRVLHVIGES